MEKSVRVVVYQYTDTLQNLHTPTHCNTI